MITKIKNELLPNHADSFRYMYESIPEHIDMYRDKINELIDAVNQLEDRSTESSESNIGSIDANEFKSAIKEICDKYNASYGDRCDGFGEELSKVVDLQPTVETIEHKISKRSTFCESGSEFPIQYVCVGCNNSSVYAYDYCPHCGAKMVIT